MERSARNALESALERKRNRGAQIANVEWYGLIDVSPRDMSLRSLIRLHDGQRIAYYRAMVVYANGDTQSWYFDPDSMRGKWNTIKRH